MSKQIIKVSEEIYTDPSTARATPDGKYVPATPEPYEPNFIEGLLHRFGRHFTFGQPYCVVCLKRKV